MSVTASPDEAARGPSLPPPIRLLAGGCTDVGRRRRRNEDRLLVRDDLGLYAVADGVRGMNTGEVASSLAVDTLSTFFDGSRDGAWPDTYRALLDLLIEPGARRLCAAVRKANMDIRELAATHPRHEGMSTTVVAAHFCLLDARLHIAHVGDSRCYRQRGQAPLALLTRDHSLRNMTASQHPGIDPALLERVPRNVITRALGLDVPVEIDIASHDVHPGDRYVLCSDGLSGMIEDAHLGAILAEPLEPRRAAEALVTAANEAGGRDNVTAVVVHAAHG